jgi:hypothetical protein
VGVLHCLLDRTMSKKSAAVGTGAMALSTTVVTRNSHAVPFCNNDQQSEGREEKEFLCSWSTAYASLSPRPASREAQGKEGSDLFTIPG